MINNFTQRFPGVRQSRIEQTKEQVEEKWIGDGGVSLAHPPEWKKLEDNIVKAVKDECIGKVCEIGCGTGRVAKLFHPKSYIGLDINPMALEVAERHNPKHSFDLIMWESLYPGATTYLFFTVMLHIPDSELWGIVRKLDNRVVIVEAMGRWIRDYGKGNNYQRDPEEYRKVFSRIGMKEKSLSHCHQYHFPYYLDIMVFE